VSGLQLVATVRPGYLRTYMVAKQPAGGNPPGRFLPPQAAGHPPLDAGPSKGVTLDTETAIREFFGAMGYDPATGIPTEEMLESLGLITLADDSQEKGG
jgi:aldehyde:ferredoxin oxidoreductase